MNNLPSTDGAPLDRSAASRYKFIQSEGGKLLKRKGMIRDAGGGNRVCRIAIERWIYL